jgi:hypothetical protein
MVEKANSFTGPAKYVGRWLALIACDWRSGLQSANKAAALSHADRHIEGYQGDEVFVRFGAVAVQMPPEVIDAKKEQENSCLSTGASTDR